MVDSIRKLNKTTLFNLAVRTGSNKPRFRSTLFISGTAKGVSLYIDAIQSTSYSMTEEFEDYRIFIYYHEMDEQVFKLWQERDSKVILIPEDASLFTQLKHKPEILAVARTVVLNSIHNHMHANGIEPSNSFLVLMDLDERNFGPRMNVWNKTLFIETMSTSSLWDSVSFNRAFYYDVWALRYDRFNANTWAFYEDSYNLVKIIRRDIVRILNESRLAGEQYLPVLSAFNGFAIYKLHFTIGCEYSAKCVEFRSKCKLSGDCEHVAFHKCMRDRHQARIMINTNYLFTEKSNEPPSVLLAISERLKRTFATLTDASNEYHQRSLLGFAALLIMLIFCGRRVCTSKACRRR